MYTSALVNSCVIRQDITNCIHSIHILSCEYIFLHAILSTAVLSSSSHKWKWDSCFVLHVEHF